MSSRAARERYSFGNLEVVLPLPDLIDVQKKSFDRFLAVGLAETFADISPITDFTGNLELEFEFDSEDEDLKGPPKFSEKECKEKDHTYSDQIFVRARFLNRNTGEIKEQTVFMGDFIMTPQGLHESGVVERLHCQILLPANVKFTCTQGQGNMLDYDFRE